jgi:transcriptional regulator with XRE-family HTH domain
VHNDSTPHWTDFDGAQLKAAREKAGVDSFAFARKVNLSTAQLLELEEGGNSYFYTPSIKFSTGKRLLSSFGGKTEYDRLSEEALIQSRIESIEVEPILEASSQVKQPELKVAYSKTKKSLLVLSAIVTICIAYAFVTYPSKSNKSQAEVQQFSASQVSNAEKSAVTESPPISAKTDLVSAVANTVPTATTPPKKEPIQSECVWSENPHNVSATRATKDGNYVYLVATKELVACIKDANNIQTTVLLKPSQAHNFTGNAPLKIHSTALNSLNIFYQGSKIQLPNQGITEIVLVAQSLQ